MAHCRHFIVIIFLLIVFNAFGLSQPVIINEIYNSSLSTDEWIELLVIQDNFNLRNWMISDFTNNGGIGQTLIFSNNSLWSSVSKGTIIVIGQSGAAFTEDTDPSDYLLMIKGTNTQYFSGGVFTIGGASEAIHIQDASGTHVIGVSWGSANANSIPQPKVHFSTSSTSNTSTSFKGDSVSQLTNTAYWAQNTTPTQAVGNTPANLTWISALKARPEGSGSVSVLPVTVNGGKDTIITVIYKKDTSYSVNNLRIIIPAGFIWSGSIDDISFIDMTATSAISGDTIYFTDIIFSSDSTVISIQNVTTPMSTGYYIVGVQSGISGSYRDVAPVPIITVYGVPVPIAETKVNDANGVALRIGDLVTVSGIVTVGSEFGSPSYIQDNSGGFSVYGYIFSDTVKIGDEVLVSGKVTQFRGLNQIEYPILHSIISSGNLTEPLTATPTQLKNDGAGGVENYEGLLVRLNGVTVTELNGDPVTVWQGEHNYRLKGVSITDTVQMRIDSSTNIDYTIAPGGSFDIIGVLGQYQYNPPYIGGYQVMPRFTSDIISEGPIISEFPYETDLSPDSLTIIWKTLNPGSSIVCYGKTISYELGLVDVYEDSMQTDHSVTLRGLTPATMYNVQALSAAGGDTSFASNLIVSTSSAPPCTGQMDVYFNKTVNTSVSMGEIALSNQDLVSRLVNRINAAHHSIDVCLYSLSANNQGDIIANALVSAKNRGVKVRVICEYDNYGSGGSSFPILSGNSIPLITDRYDPVLLGSGLMHNKFFIFDYRGGAPDSIWVWTGSWNPTLQGTVSDRQNSIEIQDVALACAYTTEFNEMWGSSTDAPNQSLTRFGARKLDNVAHNFIINGSPVSVYFSPSDQTTRQICKTLGKSQLSISTSILTFTRKDIADTIIAKKNSGKRVRIIMDNNTDLGNQYSYLQSNGVDVRLKGGSGLLHHKYAIVDGTQQGGTQWIITGSHNWSTSADMDNNENTLIIQDNRVANLYLQEFAARYIEAGGTDTITLGAEENRSSTAARYELSQNYPNPFNPSTVINYRIISSGWVTLKIYNILGQEVMTLVNEMEVPGFKSVNFKASNLPSGVYYCRIIADKFTATKKMVLLR